MISKTALSLTVTLCFMMNIAIAQSDVSSNTGICDLPKVVGICYGHKIRWYYDKTLQQCSQFVYGGCLGNENNFISKELCQERCEPNKL
ncbi:inducible serine protease inhibitor 2-like [Bicyclus anynana]|uniref:Inducible serine protease inhibitor 2-like n=1 Tax=Bicyclus anynana TaxID=110368 RepID=A0A6J1P653_BICAN|nr:inducible serine protease inhibitor 2-like [Bicyclus anynana]